MSILSTREDGYGFHYGYLPGDHRQINVRRGPGDLIWRAWLGGDPVPGFHVSKEAAEAAAIAYAKAHPVDDPDDDLDAGLRIAREAAERD